MIPLRPNKKSKDPEINIPKAEESSEEPNLCEPEQFVSQKNENQLLILEIENVKHEFKEGSKEAEEEVEQDKELPIESEEVPPSEPEQEKKPEVNSSASAVIPPRPIRLQKSTGPHVKQGPVVHHLKPPGAPKLDIDEVEPEQPIIPRRPNKDSHPQELADEKSETEPEKEDGATTTNDEVSDIEKSEAKHNGEDDIPQAKIEDENFGEPEPPVEPEISKEVKEEETIEEKPEELSSEEKPTEDTPSMASGNSDTDLNVSERESTAERKEVDPVTASEESKPEVSSETDAATTLENSKLETESPKPEEAAVASSTPVIPTIPAKHSPVIPKRPSKPEFSGAKAEKPETPKSESPASSNMESPEVVKLQSPVIPNRPIKSDEKKDPPPKPKKLSSKIAAFQQMFNQPAPEPKHEESRSFKTGRLSSDKKDFAANLQNVMGRGIALPGMANSEMLKRFSKEENEETEKNENDEAKGADVNVKESEEPINKPVRRAKGPRGKKLPKLVQESKLIVESPFKISVDEVWTLEYHKLKEVEVVEERSDGEIVEEKFELENENVKELVPSLRPDVSEVYEDTEGAVIGAEDTKVKADNDESVTKPEDSEDSAEAGGFSSQTKHVEDVESAIEELKAIGKSSEASLVNAPTETNRDSDLSEKANTDDHVDEISEVKEPELQSPAGDIVADQQDLAADTEASDSEAQIGNSETTEKSEGAGPEVPGAFTEPLKDEDE